MFDKNQHPLLLEIITNRILVTYLPTYLATIIYKLFFNKKQIMKNGLMKITRSIPLLIGLMTLFSTLNIYAQEDARILLETLEEEDLKNLDALAMYPEDTRLAILQASLYPEVLIKIDRIQSKTSEDFTTLMKQYPQQTQQAIWDLTRYPNLIHRLLYETIKDVNSVDNFLSDYPEAIHQRAKDCLKNHDELLKKVDALNQTNENAFNNIISNYENETQVAFRKLIELPEVLTVMTENIEVTILVGDAFKNYPDWVLEKSNNRHLELAQQNVQELEDWKKRIKENPEASQELQASAEDFAKENGYDDLYYESEDDDLYYDDLYYDEDNQESNVVEKHYTYNYPYWYGYPTWYAYPRWRPYPYWYDWGFHYGSRRNIAIIQMPSFYFIDWYFYRPIHHYQYPHLSAHFVGHYYGHRHSVGSVTTTVHNWQQQNREVITDDLVSHAPSRINDFKEFGKMEVEREKFNRVNPRTPLSQKKFVEKNQQSYPRLKREILQNKGLTTNGDPHAFSKKEKMKPRVHFPINKEKINPNNENPNVKRKKKIPTSQPKIRKRNTKLERRQAKDYHQKTWESTKQRRAVKTVTPKMKTSTNPKIRKPSRVKKIPTIKPSKKKKTKNN